VSAAPRDGHGIATPTPKPTRFFALSNAGNRRCPDPVAQGRRNAVDRVIVELNRLAAHIEALRSEDADDLLEVWLARYVLVAARCRDALGIFDKNLHTVVHEDVDLAASLEAEEHPRLVVIRDALDEWAAACGQIVAKPPNAVEPVHDLVGDVIPVVSGVESEPLTGVADLNSHDASPSVGNSSAPTVGDPSVVGGADTPPTTAPDTDLATAVARTFLAFQRGNPSFDNGEHLFKLALAQRNATVWPAQKPGTLFTPAQRDEITEIVGTALAAAFNLPGGES
jgi:hypothetical protein